MKKIGILFMVMLFGVITLNAQNRDGQRNFDPKERAKQTTERLKKTLI